MSCPYCISLQAIFCLYYAVSTFMNSTNVHCLFKKSVSKFLIHLHILECQYLVLPTDRLLIRLFIFFFGSNCFPLPTKACNCTAQQEHIYIANLIHWWLTSFWNCTLQLPNSVFVAAWYWLRPFMVILFPILFSFSLQMLQFSLIHHFLD